jgi:hypothetical protein
MYAFVPLETVKKFEPQMEQENVSVVARSPRGFLTAYKKYGKALPQEWLTKRENFIKRHLAQYKKNPTYRRKLALMAWAYQP